jgi:hypothetical protein
MGEELAGANVNRTYSLAGTSIAIFTFTLFFMYPKFANGDVHPVLFQIPLVVMGFATFSFVLASICYYTASAAGRVGEAERTVHSRRGDSLWLLGYSLLFLSPSLILFAVRLPVVASVWLGLWLTYLIFMTRTFPRLHR